MYCLKSRHVSETENITTATSKNGRQMRLGQCIACDKTKTQFVKRGAAGRQQALHYNNLEMASKSRK